VKCSGWSWGFATASLPKTKKRKPRMPKKKVTGLSKKVPAIFQGIANLDQKVRDEGGSLREDVLRDENPGRAVTGAAGLRFLFEAGDSSARLLVVRRAGSQWQRAYSREFEASVDAQGKRLFNWKDFPDWIKGVMAEASPKLPYEVRVLLTGSRVYVIEAEKPDVAVKELKETLVWQIADSLPFPVEDSQVMFEERGEKILMVAVENTFLNAVLRSFHAASVFPALVTVSPVAYEALNETYAMFTAGNALLIDIGENQTCSLIFHEGRFQSMRDTDLGREHVIRSMMGILVVNESHVQIGYEEAKVLYESLGIPTPNLMPDAGEPKHSQLSARMRPVFEKMIQEFRGSLNQYQKEYPQAPIQGIYLAGEGSAMKGLDEYFAEQLRSPVERLKIEQGEKSVEQGQLNLMGLACLARPQFNFASAEDLWKPKFEKYRDLLKKASFVFAAFLLLMMTVLGIQIMTGSYRLGAQQKEFRKIGADDAKIARLDGLLTRLTRAKEIQTGSITPGPALGKVFRELSYIVSPSMVLSGFSYQKNPTPAVVFKGRIRRAARAPDLVLSDFLEKLNQSKVFRHSRLESREGMESEGQNDLLFTIKTQLVTS